MSTPTEFISTLAEPVVVTTPFGTQTLTTVCYDFNIQASRKIAYGIRSYGVVDGSGNFTAYQDPANTQVKRVTIADVGDHHDYSDLMATPCGKADLIAAFETIAART